MNREFATLPAPEQEAVRRVIRRVRAEGGNPTETLSDGNEAYAYLGWQGISWGVNDARNHGFCKARGVWPEGQTA